jgi:hypothetical protein
MSFIDACEPLRYKKLAGMANPIDFSKRFMPEHLTPLFHTPAYAALSAAQQLRYNQLHASYFNEQTIFFETAMAQHILREFPRRNLPATLADGLQTFIAEEARHSRMFRELNLQCLPRQYAAGDFHFIHLSRSASFCLEQWVRRPGWFPFFLWVLLIQEERSLFCAKEFLASADSLEPNFVAAQRRHLADEVGHILWDEQLLDCIWPTLAGWQRKLNARLFAWMMGEYFTTPKRSGLRVAGELVTEFPALKELWPELRRAILGLSTQRAFNLLCYSRTVTPKAFARFDRLPEFNSLAEVLPGYEPNETNSSTTSGQRQ